MGFSVSVPHCYSLKVSCLFLSLLYITLTFIVYFFSKSSPSQLCVKPDLLEFGSNVINECVSDNTEEKKDGIVTQKIDNLERELQELREQMARIVAAQLKSGVWMLIIS